RYNLRSRAGHAVTHRQPARASRLPRTPLTPSSGNTIYPVPSIEVTAREQDMNAPPKIDPVTAHSDSDVVHWLANDTRDERFIDNIFAELCVRLQRAGIPVKRASLHVLIHHPQWLGARIMWADGMREAELTRVDYDVRERSEYIDERGEILHRPANLACQRRRSYPWSSIRHQRNPDPKQCAATVPIFRRYLPV